MIPLFKLKTAGNGSFSSAGPGSIGFTLHSLFEPALEPALMKLLELIVPY